MVDVTGEAGLARHAGVLALHVSHEVVGGRSRLLSERLALEVDGNEAVRLDLRVGQEELEESLDGALALLEEARLHVAKKLLLREGGQNVDGANAALDHGLKLAQGRVAVPDVEGDAARAHNFDRVHAVVLRSDLVLDDGHGEVHALNRAALLYHLNLFLLIY